MADNELNTLEITGDVPPDLNLEPEEGLQAVEADPAVPEPAVDEPPDPAALQADIEALEARRKKAEEDARYWRQQKAEARAQYFRDKQQAAPPAPAAETPATAPEPIADNFDDYTDFVKAHGAWSADRAVETKRAEWDREAQRQSQDADRQAKMASLQEQINTGYERFEDFEDVAMDQTVPITQTVMDILTDSPDPAGVAYYLGKNRADAVRISRLTPLAAAREIAKIETQIASNPGTPPATNKNITNAPPPVRTVGSGGSAIGKDPDKMSQAEYEAWRLSNGARPY